MNQEEWIKLHAELVEKMKVITKQKNSDYAGASAEDAFHNFSLVEKMGITSTEVGFLTRMTDKMSRISTFVKKGVLEVQDEKIEDTLLDLANYSLLMIGYIKSKKK